MLTPRPYQQRAADLAISALERSDTAAPIVSAACGAGKSIIISVIADALMRAGGAHGRVLVVTHRAELVAQNHDKLPRHLKGSIFSATIGKKDTTGDVIFANIQSIQRQWHKLPKLQAILIDECHVAGKMYAEFIANVRRVSPDVRVVGLTATPFDGRGVWLHMLPEHRIFSGISSEVGIGELLLHGHLCPLTPYRTDARLNVDGVRIDVRTGDFAQGQLQAAVDVPELVQRCGVEIKSIFAERESVLVFCSGVDHAHHVATALGGEVVTGETPKVERARLIGGFRAGKIKYLCSVDVLTTGFDAPNIDGIANLRPSRSPLIYTQLLGRGMRPHPGKNDCLVADFTDTSDHFPPLDEIEGRAPRNSSGDAPTRICDNCFSIILASLRKCPHCGQEFQFEARQEHLDPDTGLLISGVIKNEDGSRTYPVERVEYRTAVTRAGDNALVADYYAPNRPNPVASEHYNLWHNKNSIAEKDGHKWLRRLKTSAGIPTNINEALARANFGALKTPRFVTVQPGSPFPIRFLN